jgi:hypothetical protein
MKLQDAKLKFAQQCLEKVERPLVGVPAKYF